MPVFGFQGGIDMEMEEQVQYNMHLMREGFPHRQDQHSDQTEDPTSARVTETPGTITTHIKP